MCLSQCIASLNAEQEAKQLYPKDEDLVFLWLPENTGAYANDEPEFPYLCPHFGCVLRSSVLNNGGVYVVVVCTLVHLYDYVLNSFMHI